MNDFDDLSDLDEVFGPLRSSATPAELSQEAAVLERMVKARCTTEGKHMFTSRRARVATLVAAGVLGFGGMAAASPSLLGDQPAEPEPVVQPEPAVEIETVEDESIEAIEEVEPATPEPVVDVDVEPIEPERVEGVEPIAPAESAQVELTEVAPVEVAPAAVPLDDDLATAFDETTCLPGNHGATVSAVARGEFPDDVSVTDAAHSSCGKTAAVDVDDPEIETEHEAEPETEHEAEPETEHEAESESESQSEPEAESARERPGRDQGAASNGNPNENSNGKSDGNGNGKSDGNGNGNGAPGKRGG